ncbi:hypothetical protein, partial [Microcoleus sp. D3_18_C1]
MLLYLQQLEQQVPVAEHLLVAIDHTAWGRPDAKTLKDRTHEYQGGVIIGQGYSTIAWSATRLIQMDKEYPRTISLT